MRPFAEWLAEVQPDFDAESTAASALAGDDASAYLLSCWLEAERAENSTRRSYRRFPSEMCAAVRVLHDETHLPPAKLLRLRVGDVKKSDSGGYVLRTEAGDLDLTESAVGSIRTLLLARLERPALSDALLACADGSGWNRRQVAYALRKQP